MAFPLTFIRPSPPLLQHHSSPPLLPLSRHSLLLSPTLHLYHHLTPPSLTVSSWSSPSTPSSFVPTATLFALNLTHSQFQSFYVAPFDEWSYFIVFDRECDEDEIKLDPDYRNV
ncbi:hypothetical protein OWV82_023195 [Melia azedarach]|uniref:Uncharacterized protein n=1 Tax=Melia azedarach TaxID=155640 RepID=A0ACC1WVZ2_MELAZ|nr:hypothetical protein OWV82_023195 [Melia azedarach]